MLHLLLLKPTESIKDMCDIIIQETINGDLFKVMKAVEDYIKLCGNLDITKIID